MIFREIDAKHSNGDNIAAFKSGNQITAYTLPEDFLAMVRAFRGMHESFSRSLYTHGYDSIPIPFNSGSPTVSLLL